MRANVPKQKKPPRPVELLPDYQRKAIEQYYSQYFTEEAYKLADHEHEYVQEFMIKTDCIYMADFLGCTEEQLLAYIAWRKRTYRKIDRFTNRAEQDAWLAREMERCFPTCGFPQFRIDDMKSKERSVLDGRREVDQDYNGYL